MPSNFYNLNELKVLVFNDLEFLKEIVDVFIAQMPGDCAKLKNAALHGQWREVGLKAHKIKSSIRTIGIHGLYDDILEIEDNGNNEKNLEVLNHKIEEFISKINLVIADLKNETFK